MTNNVLQFPNVIAGEAVTRRAMTHADIVAQATERIQRWFRDWSFAQLQVHNAADQMPPDFPGKTSASGTFSVMQRVRVHPSGGATETLEEALSNLRNELSLTRSSFRIFVTGESKAIQPAIQEQVYGIAREALINALRHSQATSIEAEVQYFPRRLRLIVRDNGCGMNADVIRSGRRAHRGLLGMRERAATIGARIRIWSRPGAGTEIEILAPCDFAATCA